VSDAGDARAGAPGGPGAAGDDRAPTLTVSVVVPVYNPGRSIEPCIASLLAQTLPRELYEVVFVDDGSTDGTASRLDRLAASDRRVRVFHIPNSGWAGRPRNLGIAKARGEYIQLVDQDDALAPEALEELSAFGARHAADIVIGRVASTFRGVPHGLFGRTRAACTIADAPLIDSLTPHKMLRRAFLLEHGLVFAEGPRRLEDQLFMVQAYFAARVVSVLADRTYYFYRRREDGLNAGSAQIEPRGYYANLREVLDVVLAKTDPGELRDRLLRRFLRVEVLRRLSEPSFVVAEPGFRDALFDAARDLVVGMIPPDVDAGLGSIARLRAALLRAGRQEALLALARRCASVEAAAEIDEVSWHGGRLTVRGRARLDAAPGRPFPVLERGGRRSLDASLTGDLVDDVTGVTTEVGAFPVAPYVRDRVSGSQWSVPARIDLSWEPADEGDPGGGGDPSDLVTPIARFSAGFSPLGMAGGRTLDPGSWEIGVRVTAFGLDRTAVARHAAREALGGSWTPTLLGDRPIVVAPRLDEQGAVVLDVDDALIAGRGGSSPRVARDGGAVWVTLPVTPSREARRAWVTFVVRDDAGQERPFPGRVRTVLGQVVLVARPGSSLRGMPPGPHALAVRLGGGLGPGVHLGSVRVGRGGEVRAVGDWRLPLRDRVAWRLRARAEKARRHMPARARRALRAISGRLSRGRR
jgi:glycosyltransferase involved in cell wall biosynthesis